MKTSTQYWLLFALAAASFVPTLYNVQWTGEEAVYPLMAYEMWQAGEYLKPIMYGSEYWRPPLFNLLIMALSNLIGWEHMLLASRLISAIATVGSGLLVAWFTSRVSGDRILGAFAALIFITLGDIFFYNGWLAYSDPLFALFTLAGMLFGWLAVFERRISLFAIAGVALACAFLTKALTAYIFYAVAVLVAAYTTRHWRFLFSMPSIVLNIITLALPFIWFAVMSNNSPQSQGMFDDILSKLVADGVLNYLREFVSFPLHAFTQFLPIAGVVLYVRYRKELIIDWSAPLTQAAALIVFINFLPYWLSPQSGMRYILPLYGVSAIFFATVLIHHESASKLALKWIIAAIAVKWFFSLWAFPFYTEHKRPNIDAIATDILSITGDSPLYVHNVAWAGIAVVADITKNTLPRSPLVFPPSGLASGYLIDYADTPIPAGWTTVKTYREVRLLCTGDACHPHQGT
ncbi:MAG: ArnT family glycosyltransferase [Halothiobacillaceae bacterium]